MSDVQKPPKVTKLVTYKSGDARPWEPYTAYLVVEGQEENIELGEVPTWMRSLSSDELLDLVDWYWIKDTYPELWPSP